MRHLENAFNNPATQEQPVAPKKWQGRVFEKPELACYEAVFVIELCGISVGVNNPVMPVSLDNSSANQTSNVPSFKESTQ
jgi:hypothetical protein